MTVIQKLKILHLEDVPTDAELVKRELTKSTLVFERLLVDNEPDYVTALDQFKPDIILSDHSLPSFNSLQALSILKASGLDIPFILITATISEEFAVDIMKEGAADYILKDRMQRLPSAIEKALEKHKLQAERQKANQTQAAILNALASNITLLNEKGKIVAVNESWKKSALLNNLGMPNYGVGYSYIAIAEKANAVDVVTANQITKGIRDVIVGNRNEFTIEFASKQPTETRWFEIVVAPLADNNHKGAVVLHIDITDRKRAEESLIQSEANLRSVFENTDQSIILLDTDLKIISFNSNANGAIFKQFQKKLKVGNDILRYFPKDRKIGIKKAVKRVNNGEMVMYETTFTLPNGTVEWYETKWMGVINQKMEDAGFILTFKDITNKKQAEKESNIMTADLVQRNKDLEQFAYIVSHNLRAPVANIRGLLNLDAFNPADEDGKETLQALSVSVNSLDKVIIDLNHVLQVSSQVNDKMELVSLTALVEEIRSGISQMILKNNATITYDFDEIDELMILKSYMYSIFQNLIINSIKYRRANERPVITISSKTNGNLISILFKDNGKGIDMDKNGPYLFGLYKRFDKSVEGKGMGLFMVKTQVESLGGRIKVHSEVNHGTQFLIEFPLEDRNQRKGNY
jgi:PAS domain S-box-containing protein